MTYDVVWHGGLMRPDTTTRGELLPPRPSRCYGEVIAEALNVHGQNLAPRRHIRRVSDTERATMRQLYAGGVGVKDIAVRLGRDKQTVWAALRHGVVR